jgi:branched-chain amino acid transport system permease protein
MSAGSAGATALQLLFAGVGNGAIYALIALGFNVIFKSTGALNFAQGEWVMLGGMIAAAAIASHAAIWAGCLVAVVIVAAVGLLSERLIVAPLKRPTPMLITLLSIGLAISTKSVVMLVLGKDPAGYPGFSGDAVLNILGARVPAQTLWIIGITLVFIVIAHVFFERTIVGKSLRAVAADRDAASLVGINVDHSVMWSFVIGALAGGIAGAIITPQTFTSYDQGGLIGFKGFSAAMLGGIGNLYGALVGGLVLGLLETFAAGYVSSHFKDAVAFIVLLTILFALPSGLLGRSEAERV